MSNNLIKKAALLIPTLLISSLILVAQEKYPFKEYAGFDMYSARNDQNKYGYVDYEEKTIIPFQYDYVESFGRRPVGEPGWATVAVGSRFGIIDLKGKVIVPLEYDFADEINSGFFMVQKNGLWGIYNSMGKLSVPLSYNYIYPIVSKAKTLAAVKNNKWGVIKTDNTVLVPFEYALITTNVDGKGKFTAYSSTTKVEIDPDGKILNPEDETFVYSNDMKYKLTDNRKEGVGLKNNKNEIILATEYYRVFQLEDNLPYFEVIKEEKKGLFNADTKKWILPFEFESIYMASNSIFCTSTYVSDEKETYKYFDLKGSPLFGKTFDYGGAFDFTTNHYAIVQKGDKWGAIDKTGKQVLPFDFVEMPGIGYDKKIIGLKETGWGVMDEQFNIIIPFRYVDHIDGGTKSPFIWWKNEAFFGVQEKSTGKYGVIKKDGTAAIPLGKYEKIGVLNDVEFGKTKVYYVDAYNYDEAAKGFIRCGINLNENKTIIPMEYADISFSRTNQSGIVTTHKVGEKNDGLFFINEQKNYSSDEFTYDDFDEETGVFIAEKMIDATPFAEKFKYAFIDKNGKEITGFVYDKLESIGEKDYYYARKGSKVGIVNTHGDIILPFKYDVFYSIEASGKRGNEIEPFFRNGYIYFREGTKTVLLDNKFNTITDTKTMDEPGTSVLSYLEMGSFNAVESRNIFYRNPEPETKKLLLNNNVYENVNGSYSFDGASLKSKERYWGFKKGLMAVMKNGKYGYLDYTGKEVIPFEFEEATSFDVLGIASVKKNNEWYTINRLGQRLEFSNITTAILKAKKN